MKLYEPTAELKICPEEVCTAVVDAAFAVHQYFGPGQFESIYRKALEREIGTRGIAVAAEVPVSVQWRSEDLGVGFRADLVVAESLVLELKAVDSLHLAHTAQLMGYFDFYASREVSSSTSMRCCSKKASSVSRSRGVRALFVSSCLRGDG